ncbi:hypothetical protein [Microbulbifer discodermiae]|uniref:hypothetical protein n=1 Tax=Microbulbifer sp. 2201CG32-9 TaxID=3232309 RepID=UPI00345C08EB
MKITFFAFRVLKKARCLFQQPASELPGLIKAAVANRDIQAVHQACHRLICPGGFADMRRKHGQEKARKAFSANG